VAAPAQGPRQGDRREGVAGVAEGGDEDSKRHGSPGKAAPGVSRR
jgi:hypothetical protein